MHKVSPESLDAFIACVDYGGFSKAAKKLQKSQATVSILVSNLEDDLNITLFDRTKRTPLLTTQGETIYAYARNIVMAQQELFRISGTLKDTIEPSVTLILSDYIPIEQSERLKSQFITKSKGIKLTFLSAESHNAERMLLTGEADLAVIPALKSRMNYPIELVSNRTWLSTNLGIYCADTHPLHQVENITDMDLKHQRRIKLMNGTLINKSPRDDIFIDNIFRAFRLCVLGVGWCELPEWVVDNQFKSADNQLIKLNIPPSKKILEFDILYRNEPKGYFSNWLINTLTKR